MGEKALIKHTKQMGHTLHLKEPMLTEDFNHYLPNSLDKFVPLSLIPIVPVYLLSPEQEHVGKERKG